MGHCGTFDQCAGAIAATVLATASMASVFLCSRSFHPQLSLSTANFYPGSTEQLSLEQQLLSFEFV